MQIVSNKKWIKIAIFQDEKIGSNFSHFVLESSNWKYEYMKVFFTQTLTNLNPLSRLIDNDILSNFVDCLRCIEIKDNTK